MKGKRFTEELIIRVLQEAESVLTAADVPIVYKQHPQNDSGKHQRQRSAIESCGLVAFLFLLWRGGPWQLLGPARSNPSFFRSNLSTKVSCSSNRYWYVGRTVPDWLRSAIMPPSLQCASLESHTAGNWA